MGNQRVRCMFCFMQSGESSVPSKEHLLSRPVAEAFGIELDSPVLRADGDTGAVRWSRLSGLKFGCVCTRCNNGWMNVLEHEMRGVASWLQGDPHVRLGDDLNLALRKWAVKTHMLLCFIDGNAARFGHEDSAQEYVVPPYSPARQMYEGNLDAILHGAAVGLSRSGSSSDFVWSFGFPSVRGVGPAGRARFAPATVLTLGGLQLWVVVPLLDAEVIAPEGVVTCTPKVRPRDLRTLDHPMTPRAVTVAFA